MKIDLIDFNALNNAIHVEELKGNKPYLIMNERTFDLFKCVCLSLNSVLQNSKTYETYRGCEIAICNSLKDYKIEIR